MKEREALAFEATLYHAGDRSQLKVRVYLPVEQPPHPDHRASHWRSAFEVERDGKIHSSYAGGVDWLQALLIAIEGVRQHIPGNEENDWRTADDVPSWMMMPRQVSIGWGRAAYVHACQQLDDTGEKWLRGEFRGRD